MEIGRDPSMIHYTKLGPSAPDSPLAVEWETYRREVGRLLAEGYEGKHVLIKGDQIIGLYKSLKEALTEGHRRYMRGPFMVHQVQEWERLIRTPLSYGPIPYPVYPRSQAAIEADPWTIHYTELVPSPPGSQLAVEWETYRREVGRLLAEGHEGKHVLIKGERILGLFDTRGEAREEGLRRFLLQPFLVHQVQERERLLRTRWSYL